MRRHTSHSYLRCATNTVDYKQSHGKMSIRDRKCLNQSMPAAEQSRHLIEFKNKARRAISGSATRQAAGKRPIVGKCCPETVIMPLPPRFSTQRAFGVTSRRAKGKPIRSTMPYLSQSRDSPSDGGRLPEHACPGVRVELGGAHTENVYTLRPKARYFL